MEYDMLDDEIDDINCAIELSLLDLNHSSQDFDESSSSNNYVDENEVEDEELARAREESLKQSELRHHRRMGNNGNIPVCDVCDQPIRTSFGKREFWNQIFCHSHLFDNTPTCCGCMRLKSKEVVYVELGDGRDICLDCYQTAILDGQKCRPLLEKCRRFFKTLNMKLRDDIPLYLVDKSMMTKLTSRGVSTGPVHPDTMILGLTINDSPPVEIVRNHRSGGGKMELVKGTQHQRHGIAITIAVLFGLPKVMTGAIFAHEMMHAWLRLQGVRGLEPKVEEGICQVIAHKWLDWVEADSSTTGSSSGGGGDGGDGGDSSEQVWFVKNLIETFKHQVEMDSSKAYGEGFRDAQWAVAKYGLQVTINYIVTHGALPQK